MRFHRQSPQPLAYASPPIQTWHGVSLPGAQHRRLLLVLDNFEHLLPAMGFVAYLLAASPPLTILTTTREALRIGGERRYTVGPLDVPRLQRKRTSRSSARFHRWRCSAFARPQ